MSADPLAQSADATMPDRNAMATLHATLNSRVIHQDQLGWSCLQLLIAVQGALLVAAYGFRQAWLGPLVLIFAVMLTLAVLVLIRADYGDRHANIADMDAVVDQLLEGNDWDSLRERRHANNATEEKTQLGRKDRTNRLLNYSTSHALWFGWSPTDLAQAVVIAFIVIDVTLAVVIELRLVGILPSLPDWTLGR